MPLKTLRYLVATNDERTRKVEARPSPGGCFALSFATRSEPDATWGPPLPGEAFFGSAVDVEAFLARAGYPKVERIFS